MLCGYQYDLCPLPTEEEARAFLTRRQFKAINVTIPYKKLVMEYCSYIDPRAKAIGAVNTVVNKNGLLYGYNTDYLGFAHLCDAHGVNFAGKTVLILGTGGTHNTTSAVARDKGAAKVLTVSRHPDPKKGELSYAEAVSSGAQIVVNTTPAGMYPNVGVCNLDVAAMPGLGGCSGCGVQPRQDRAHPPRRGSGRAGGCGRPEMLVAQAVYAAEYFLDRKFEDAPVEIRRITAALRRDMLNIALIGMPSSGKTTLGRMLARSLGRTFVDLDEEIVKTDGRSIPDIFAAEGEDGFRTKETAETQRFGKEGRQLISCGGGIVKSRRTCVPCTRTASFCLSTGRWMHWPWAAAGRFLPAWTHCARWKHSAARCIWQRQMPSSQQRHAGRCPCMPPWRHWMKFLILNGPNLNIMRWSEPGVPGELDYNAIMDYVQAGCDQLGIETDCCQSNHEGRPRGRNSGRSGPGGRHRAEPWGLRPLQRGHSGCAAPVRRTRRGSDAARPGRAGAFPQDGRGVLWLSGPLHRGEGPQGYLHACIYLAQLLRTDGSSKAHIVM